MSNEIKTIFDMFKTDEAVERAGVRVDYGVAWFQVARAGGANERYEEVLQAKAAPLRRAIEGNILPAKTLRKLQRETLVETLLLGWGSPQFGDGKIADAKGKPLDFSTANALEVLASPGMQDLADDLLTQARSFAAYRSAVVENEAGN